MMSSIVEMIEDQMTATGNTYVCHNDIFAGKKEDIKKNPVKTRFEGHEYELTLAIDSGELVARTYRGKMYYSLPYVRKMERSIARNICHQKSQPNNVPDLTDSEVDALIEEFEAQSEQTMGFKCTLHEEQRNAVRMAVNSHVCVVTGGPGTGKTTVINAIIYAEKHRKGRERRPLICFSAPTGKAARRITESVKVPANTVQKMIGANEYKETPYIIDCDIVVVDEVSMLDTVTLYQLMRAVSDNTRIFFVGDVDQLPSVGIGSCLRDIIDCGSIPVTKLEKTFRQAEGSCLAENINYVRHGFEKLEKGDDFVVSSDFDEKKIVDTLVESYISARDEFGADNVVLLTPFRRKGETCANAMNEILQNILNPNGKAVDVDVEDTDDDTGEIYRYHINLREGDPVMQLVNRKDCPIANGDVGKVITITKDEVIVDYGHYVKPYKFEELKELTLAYAMSVHKSQGSEYKCVITCFLPEHQRLLNRNLIYTAITRAKKKCIVFAKEDVLKSALTIEGGYIRQTFLCREIEDQTRKNDLLESVANLKMVG